MSGDVAKRGQYAEIKKLKMSPPSKNGGKLRWISSIILMRLQKIDKEHWCRFFCNIQSFLNLKDSLKVFTTFKIPFMNHYQPVMKINRS